MAPLHLFTCSAPVSLSPPSPDVVQPADVAAVLELTANQIEVLTEVLASLSHANSATAATSPSGSTDPAFPSATPPPLGQEHISVHELSLFLLAQLFSKEAQRPDAVEYWPDPNGGAFGAGFGASPGGFGPAGSELMSPTRRSQSGGESATPF